MPAADPFILPGGADNRTKPDSFPLPEGSAPIALAVSGGGDSMALLTMAAEACPAAANRLIALSVDHGLRAEARAEAEAVGRHCASIGVAHRILAWSRSRPDTGLMAAARQARYRLLCEAARQAGGHVVLTGHTFDDQLETLAMRAARGDGPGMAGIAPATLFGGRTWFLRPLLGHRRNALRSLLRARAIAWTEDPSNADPRFERVRWRMRMAGSEAGDAAMLTGKAQAEARRRRTVAEAAAQAIADPAIFDIGDWPDGFTLRPGGDMAPEVLAEVALQASRLLSARAYGPVPVVRARLAALASGGGGRAFTAGGAVFRQSGGRLSVTRDPRARAQQAGLPLLIPCFEYPLFAALAVKTGLDPLPREPAMAQSAGGL